MAKTIIMPKLGFDMAEGTLIRWLKTEGDHVDKGEVLAEIETDKATIEVEASHSGVIRRLAVSEGSSVPVGAPIAVVGEAEEEIDFESLLNESPVGETQAEEAVLKQATQQPAETVKKDPAPLPAQPTDGNGRIPGGVKASPLARRLARDHNIDLKSLAGSGQGNSSPAVNLEPRENRSLNSPLLPWRLPWRQPKSHYRNFAP
jgi:pyruvate dehydrogenase E2 component (dihydrolipoamide acetyltransferase)